MKKAKYILLVCCNVIIATTSCDTFSSYFDYRLKVINESDKTIYTYFNHAYPDTAIGKLPYFTDKTITAKPNESITLARGGSWETAFKEQINQKLIVLIFDANVVNSTPWDTIRKNYSVLKRYDLSLEDIEHLNWTISYPPTEAMKDMKMYPPYEAE